jgi:hypothetical protein
MSCTDEVFGKGNCHHRASARAYDFTVFDETRWTRRYSRNSSAGPTGR